jgi:hypothetical protein
MAIGHWLEATADRLRFKPTAIGQQPSATLRLLAIGSRQTADRLCFKPTAIGQQPSALVK